MGPLGQQNLNTVYHIINVAIITVLHKGEQGLIKLHFGELRALNLFEDAFQFLGITTLGCFIYLRLDFIHGSLLLLRDD